MCVHWLLSTWQSQVPKPPILANSSFLGDSCAEYVGGTPTASICIPVYPCLLADLRDWCPEAADLLFCAASMPSPKGAAAPHATRPRAPQGHISAWLLQGTVTSWLPVRHVRCKCPCASSPPLPLTFCCNLEKGARRCFEFPTSSPHGGGRDGGSCSPSPSVDLKLFLKTNPDM